MNWRQTLLSTALVGGCIWCAGLVQKVYSEEKAAAAAEPPFKPVSPVEPLMEAQEEQFNAIKKQLSAAGKEDFKAIERYAYVLAELCNVNHYQSEKDDYRKWAFEARDLSVALAKAAKAKEVDKAKDTFKQIYTKCGECHDKYK